MLRSKTSGSWRRRRAPPRRARSASPSGKRAEALPFAGRAVVGTEWCGDETFLTNSGWLEGPRWTINNWCNMYDKPYLHEEKDQMQVNGLVSCCSSLCESMRKTTWEGRAHNWKSKWDGRKMKGKLKWAIFIDCSGTAIRFESLSFWKQCYIPIQISISQVKHRNTSSRIRCILTSALDHDCN